MKSQEYIDLENRYGAHNYKPLNVVLTRGEGIWVWDVDGNRYMDCLSAYSAVNQGHCHPAIMQTMVDQAKLLTLTSRAFRNDAHPMCPNFYALQLSFSCWPFTRCIRPFRPKRHMWPNTRPKPKPWDWIA